MNTLRIISERPIEDIFSHLSQYESTKLALKLLQRKDKNNTLTPELAEAKAIGVAYCLRNAREYLRQTEVSWTTRLLNGYYGMMALTGALMIADPNNTHTLQDFEGFTKKGHGISNIDSKDPFPKGQLIYLTDRGLFLEFAAHLGLKLDAFTVKNRPDSIKDLHRIEGKHLTLDTLLACIPELADLYFNVTGKPPKSSPYEMKSASPMGGPKFGNQSLPDPPEDPNAADAFPPGLRYLLTSPYHQTLEDCKAMQNYFQPLDIIQRTNDGPAIRGYVLGESEEACLARIPSHQSALVPPSWFDAPFGEVKDMLAVHFLLTYHLSIIVRYRPSLWREITEGEYNDYFSLIRQYHHVFTRVVPQMVLERLEGRPVQLVALFNEVQIH